MYHLYYLVIYISVGLIQELDNNKQLIFYIQKQRLVFRKNNNKYFNEKPNYYKLYLKYKMKYIKLKNNI